jgi:hypothetical protein
MSTIENHRKKFFLAQLPNAMFSFKKNKNNVAKQTKNFKMADESKMAAKTFFQLKLEKRFLSLFLFFVFCTLTNDFMKITFS